MSLETLFTSAIANKLNPVQDIAPLISELTKSIKSLVDITPKSAIFLKGSTALSSNVAANVLILAGSLIPSGYKATVEDFNIIFSTAAGTIRLVIMDSNFNIIQPLLVSISNTTNGLGKTVLEENQRLAIVGETAGAGSFTTYCSGILQKNQRLDVQ